MIFSDAEVARRMQTDFECVWESVGTAPEVRIDFGSGLEHVTTLGGNVMTTFCDASGRPFDVLPGVTTPEAYAATLAEVAEGVPNVSPEESTEESSGETLRPFVIGDPGLLLASASAEADEPSSMPPSVRVLASKVAIELPMLELITENQVDHDPGRAPEPYGTASLLADTRKVRESLQPAARRLLSELAPETPDDLVAAVFLETMLIDLQDPFVGMEQTFAPKVSRRP